MKAATALLALLAVQAAAQPPESVRFITCPVYRDADAGKKSGCWLADEHITGTRYDISMAPTKPDWNHEVLVEGHIAIDQSDACGGIVLDPARVSVLPGPCTRKMLPAEGYPGRVFVLPERNVRPLSEAREVPPPPYRTRTFHLLFDFDKAFMVYQLDDYLIDQALTYIRAANPERVIVTGHAATLPEEVSGRLMAENPKIAQQRAEIIAESLRRLGVSEDQLEVRWAVDAQPVAAEGADGITESSRRRVDIEVVVEQPPQ